MVMRRMPSSSSRDSRASSSSMLLDSLEPLKVAGSSSNSNDIAGVKTGDGRSVRVAAPGMRGVEG